MARIYKAVGPSDNKAENHDQKEDRQHSQEVICH